ncbi:EpsG family protein [Elizabethkingia anophelis]|uniref:EpsG family protein n=1 Tax=Elizabethkingia anophelis TaxID=1117645 RepID=UPI0021A2F235|nr:EpsG family protein [Elizabethkingia anophelis]MCT3977719.1 EpsG family protein [Elizabethkingia anophelis]MCT4041334.1 EpsG family protein [Elizabethkingia anophelis]MCT4174030.1 EpsG family protein [Elizabethkingia anophelis]MCT4177711.1 EpsG family protein [Elizabethkingia anophelis]
MIYLILLFIFIFFSIKECIYNRRNWLLTLFICIILVLFASLRNQVGTDWVAYYNYYKYGVNNVEVGYATLNNFFSSLELPYNFFLLIINLISIILLYKSSKELSAIPALSLLIYYSDLYLYFNFSGMRQAIALSITCFALIFCFGKKRNLFKFLGLILCAMSFHLSSAIFIITFFIPRKKFDKKHYIIFLISLFFFSSLIYLASSLLTGVFAARAEFYLEKQEQAGNILSLFFIGIVRRLIPIVIIIFYGRKSFFKDDLSAYLFNLYIIGVGIFATSYLISPDIGVRLSAYFTILEIFIWANLIAFIKKINVKIVVLIIIYIVCTYKICTYIKYPSYEYNSIIG